MEKNRGFVVSEFVKICDELATYEANFVILNGHGQQVVGLQSQTFLHSELFYKNYHVVKKRTRQNLWLDKQLHKFYLVVSISESYTHTYLVYYLYLMIHITVGKCQILN